MNRPGPRVVTIVDARFPPSISNSVESKIDPPLFSMSASPMGAHETPPAPSDPACRTETNVTISHCLGSSVASMVVEPSFLKFKTILTMPKGNKWARNTFQIFGIVRLCRSSQCRWRPADHFILVRSEVPSDTLAIEQSNYPSTRVHSILLEHWCDPCPHRKKEYPALDDRVLDNEECFHPSRRGVLVNWHCVLRAYH